MLHEQECDCVARRNKTCSGKDESYYFDHQMLLNIAHWTFNKSLNGKMKSTSDATYRLGVVALCVSAPSRLNDAMIFM